METRESSLTEPDSSTNPAVAGQDHHKVRKKTVTDRVFDLRNEMVKVGDTIAYAATDGRSSGLRVGKVIEIVSEHQKFDSWDKEKEYPRTVPLKIRVLVDQSSGYWAPEKPVLIEAGFRRFVKLG